MFNGEPAPPPGQDMLAATDSQILRENAKLKQELAEAREELKRLKDILADKEEHKKMLEQDAEFHTRYWLPEEHSRFLTGLKMYGHKDIKSIARFVGSRTATQVRTHAQKYFMKLDKHGKSLGEMGLPDRPEGGLVGKNGLGLGGEHTPTDEMGAARKVPSSDAKRQKLVAVMGEPEKSAWSYDTSESGQPALPGNPFFMQQATGSAQGGHLLAYNTSGQAQPPAPPGS